MSKKQSYTVTVFGWEKHNGRKKKGYSHFLISSRFCDDEKLISVSSSAKLLYMWLLCRCSDESRSVICMSHVQPMSWLGRGHVLQRSLTELQEVQLLSYASNDVLIKRKEIKEKEMKGNETNSAEVKIAEPEPPVAPEPEPTSKPSTRATKVASRGCIPELELNPISTELLTGVTEASQRAWLAAYPSPEWIGQELMKANAWMASNPKKAPKDFGKFMTNWLSRAFESYRKGIPSRRMTYSENNAQALGELFAKVQGEEA